MPLFYASPLEQFQIFSVFYGSSLLKFYPLCTNSTLFELLIFSFLLLSLNTLTLCLKVVPQRAQVGLELAYTFVYTLISSILKQKGQKFFPFIFFLFLFIALSNLTGMIPYSFTITSHIFLTFSLATSLMLGITITGVLTHKIKFIGFFMPSGAPLALAPLFVILEIISYLMRAISLSIRLSSNLIAGHTLLKILAAFV